MPRTYKPKGVHTSPDKAGEQNLKDVELPKDENGLMNQIFPVYEHGNSYPYSGQWTDEKLAESVSDFFKYCMSTKTKPTQPLLLLWLSVDRTTVWEWRNKPEKYGVKSHIIKNAFHIMEAYLQGNIDKYPTGSIFLLKTSHGHVESSKLDITTNGQNVNNVEDVKDLVSKLGLDKKVDE